jgi:cation diffusion facilitator family transporter
MGHEHHHHHEVKISDGYKNVLKICFALNFLMFFIEFGFGYIAHSISLIADSIDFLEDSSSYLIAIIIIGKALKTRSKFAILNGSSMVLLGIFTLYQASDKIINGITPTPSIMLYTAFAALVTNVYCATLLFKYKSGDSHMESIWLCSRNDAINNVFIMIAAGLVYYFESKWPDIILGGVFSIIALRSGIGVIRSAIKELKN